MGSAWLQGPGWQRGPLTELSVPSYRPQGPERIPRGRVWGEQERCGGVGGRWQWHRATGPEARAKGGQGKPHLVPSPGLSSTGPGRRRPGWGDRVRVRPERERGDRGGRKSGPPTPRPVAGDHMGPPGPCGGSAGAGVQGGGRSHLLLSSPALCPRCPHRPAHPHHHGFQSHPDPEATPRKHTRTTQEGQKAGGWGGGVFN